MPPFIQCRQPPDDSWVTFDLAVASTIYVRQPPDDRWVPFTIGGGGGGGRFVREFPSIAAMVADTTLVAGDVCVCIDTEPNRWFNILTSADPLIRNIVLTIAGGGGLQAHQVPSADDRIWIGPPRGGSPAVDDAADITAAVAYASVHQIPDIGCIPSPTLVWAIRTEVIGSSNVETHWNPGDVVHVYLSGGVPWAPRPAAFCALHTQPPGTGIFTPIPIDPPTNAWIAYEGQRTIIVPSITIPSPLAVNDEIQIYANDGIGNVLTWSTHQIIAIVPSGGNFILTIDPPVPWPIPNAPVVVLAVIVRPKGIIWNGHGAIIAGNANRFFHFQNAYQCGYKNWVGDDAKPIANFSAFDYGCLKCWGENTIIRTNTPTANGFSFEINNESQYIDCAAVGPWANGFEINAYGSVLIRPRASGCVNGLNIVDSWHCKVLEPQVEDSIALHLRVTNLVPSNICRDIEIRNSIFLGQCHSTSHVITFGTGVVENCHFSEDHYWEAQTWEEGPPANGGNLFYSAGNDIRIDNLVISGEHTIKTTTGITCDLGGRIRIQSLSSYQTAQVLTANNNSIIDTRSADIDCTTALQSINNTAVVHLASTNGKLVFGKLNLRMRPDGGSVGFYLTPGIASWEEDIHFIGPSAGVAVFGGTVRIAGKLELSTVGPMIASLSRGIVQLNGNVAVAVAFADITINDSLKLTPITYAGTPGKFPTYTIVAGTGFSVVGDALDTSTYAYEISG